MYRQASRVAARALRRSSAPVARVAFSTSANYGHVARVLPASTAVSRVGSLQYGLQRRTYASEAPVVQKVPPMGDSITEGTVQKWLKAAGDAVQADELVAQIETDKVVVDIRAPTSGTFVEAFAKEGDNVLVGSDLYKFSPGAVPSKPAAPKAEQPAKAEAPKAEAKKEPASASAKAAAPPSSAAPPAPSAPAAEPARPAAPAPKPASPASSSAERAEHRERMPKIRVRIAQRLKDAQNTYAMLTTFQEVDMSALMALRSQYKDEFEKKHGVKLGFMSAFVKASATALAEQPIVNAVIDSEKNEIVYRDYVDISVAVAGPAGLVVPVLRDCGSKTFSQIEKAIGAFGKKARDGTLTIEEMTGGTFTISNGGVYGSLFGTPILNPPQSAILGMHAINKRPVVVNDQVVVRPMMYLALTYDHRIIDGKDAVTFLRRIKEIIEEPVRFVLE